jgi:hypothetical protein
MTRKANPRLPALRHKTALVIVFVDNATKMGTAASAEVSFPALASVATEIAAGSTLASPAIAAVATTPLAPNHAFMACEARSMAESMLQRQAQPKG